MEIWDNSSSLLWYQDDRFLEHEDTLFRHKKWGKICDQFIYQ